MNSWLLSNARFFQGKCLWVPSSMYVPPTTLDLLCWFKPHAISLLPLYPFHQVHSDASQPSIFSQEFQLISLQVGSRRKSPFIDYVFASGSGRCIHWNDVMLTYQLRICHAVWLPFYFYHCILPVVTEIYSNFIPCFLSAAIVQVVATSPSDLAVPPN